MNTLNDIHLNVLLDRDGYTLSDYPEAGSTDRFQNQENKYIPKINWTKWDAGERIVFGQSEDGKWWSASCVREENLINLFTIEQYL